MQLELTDLSTVVVASERVNRPSEHASSDIFNKDNLWDYGANFLPKEKLGCNKDGMSL